MQQINYTDANDLVYHIRAERDEFVLGIQLLNPFHNFTTEKLFVYDFRHVKHDDRIQVTKTLAFSLSLRSEVYFYSFLNSIIIFETFYAGLECHSGYCVVSNHQF